jgi:hypothetical protein
LPHQTVASEIHHHGNSKSTDLSCRPLHPKPAAKQPEIGEKPTPQLYTLDENHPDPKTLVEIYKSNKKLGRRAHNFWDPC